MAVCSNCGANGSGRYCPSCGSALSKTAAPPAILPNHTAGALAYILGPVTGVLFLTLEPYNRNSEVRFHAWQSLLFGTSVFLIFLAGPLLSFVLPWALLAIIGFAELAVLMLCLVAWLALMYKAYVGDRWVLPIIGPIASRNA